MAWMVQGAVLVRSVETGETVNAPCQLLQVSPDGKLWFDDKVVELVDMPPPGMDFNPTGFTDPEEAEHVIGLCSRLNEDALVLEPRSVFNKAVVGMACGPDDSWTRKGRHWVLVYDFELAARALSQTEAMSLDEAAEWVSFNSMGAWVGEGTPTWSLAQCD